MSAFGENIRVAAIFDPGKPIRPIWFQLGHRQHKVVETTYTWKDRVGETPLVHFAVSDGESLFELVYHPLDGRWTLASRQALV